jgi:hypothetical protein
MVILKDEIGHLQFELAQVQEKIPESDYYKSENEDLKLNYQKLLDNFTSQEKTIQQYKNAQLEAEYDTN